MTAGILFTRVLTTELLKLRRTLALAMVFVSPLLVVLLYFLIGFFGADRLARRPADQWLEISQNTVGLWTLLMMPMFVTLETSLLAGLEHADRNWKTLLTLPPPRWMIYIGKWLIAVGMLWTAHALLVAATFMSGALLRHFRPVLQIASLAPDPLVHSMIKISATALLALTIQHWVSLRWHSFTVAMGFGMCAMVVGFVAVNSGDYGPWVPWSMSMYAVRPRPGAPDPLTVAAIGAALVAVAGAWEFGRRDFA